MLLSRIRLALHWQMLISIVFAAAAGWAAGEHGALFGLRWFAVFEFLGSLFLNVLKMIILPLIAASIIASIAAMREGLARLGGRTLGFYLLSSSLAALVGAALAFEAKRAGVASQLHATGSLSQLADIFLRMIPTNILDAASDNGRILAVIFFSVLFGYALSRLRSAAADTVRQF